MLISLNGFQLQLVANLDIGENLALLLVLGFLVQNGKTVKFYGKSSRPEIAAVSVYVNGNRVQNSVCHLARDKSFPYQLVKLILLGRKAVLYPVGGNFGHRGTYRLVSVLGVGF